MPTRPGDRNLTMANSRRRRSTRTQVRITGASPSARAPARPARSQLAWVPRAWATATYRRGIEPYARLPRRKSNRLAVLVKAMHRARGAQARRSLIRNPSMPRPSTMCARRARRRKLMFIKGVAGRSWGSGGPNMRGARRTPDSSFSCRS